MDAIAVAFQGLEVTQVVWDNGVLLDEDLPGAVSVLTL